MENISSVADLKNAIQILEFELEYKEQLLKEQFYYTYESLKPVNLLKSSLHDISSSPFLIDNILGAALGLATGFLTKKIVVGVPVTIARKLLGSLLQFGVSKIVSQHTGTLQSIGQFVFQRIFRKKRNEF